VSARLAGQVALVTGGSRGIGAAIVRAFAAEGAHVAFTYRTGRNEAFALAEEVAGSFPIELDVRRSADVRTAVERVITELGTLDVLVNNAGWLQQKDFFEITDEDFAQAIDVNLKGPFIATQAAGRHFRTQNKGCIINVASVGGQLGGPKAPHYSAAKAALITFTRSSARLLSPFGVRVNAIAPGMVKTEMMATSVARDGEDTLARQTLLGRLADPAEIASVAVFLASEESGYITGQVLSVNGGQFLGG
jgi:NAD(P)-dependent dehydrogenase (short-subunit alcohol dehydrogenase family)